PRAASAGSSAVGRACSRWDATGSSAARRSHVCPARVGAMGAQPRRRPHVPPGRGHERRRPPAVHARRLRHGLQVPLPHVRLTVRSSDGNTARMSIDFTLPPDVEETRARVREFMDEVVRPAEEKVYANAPNGEPDRSDIVRMIIELRQKAHEWNVWLPHMPKEWGGLGLGITAMAFVSAEAA